VVAGGFSSSRRAISSVEMYNPELDQWEFLPDLVAVRDAPCSGVVLDGKMHVVQKGTCTAQVYDPTTKRWVFSFSDPRSCLELFVVAAALS
jgi:hypothetical protein